MQARGKTSKSLSARHQQKKSKPKKSGWVVWALSIHKRTSIQLHNSVIKQGQKLIHDHFNVCSIMFKYPSFFLYISYLAPHNHHTWHVIMTLQSLSGMTERCAHVLQTTQFIPNRRPNLPKSFDNDALHTFFTTWLCRYTTGVYMTKPGLPLFKQG